MRSHLYFSNYSCTLHNGKVHLPLNTKNLFLYRLRHVLILLSLPPHTYSEAENTSLLYYLFTVIASSIKQIGGTLNFTGNTKEDYIPIVILFHFKYEFVLCHVAVTGQTTWFIGVIGHSRCKRNIPPLTVKRNTFAELALSSRLNQTLLI